MVQHQIYAPIGLEILQIIYAIVQMINASLASQIMFIFCMAMCIFQIVLLAKQSYLNIFTQLAINVISIVAHQNKQFLVLQSLIGFVLLKQTDQKNQIINILTCLIQVSIICIFSQNTEIQSYFISVLTTSILTYFFWVIKLPKLKKQSSAVELIPLHLQPSARSMEDIPVSSLSAIVLETQTLDILNISQDLKNKLLGVEISEFNLLDKILIQKVDKVTQKSVLEKIKGFTLRQLLQKFLILQRKDSILIIRTNLDQLEYFIIKIIFEKDRITLYFFETKEYAKYIKKHSCFALMNKLFQSFSHEFGTLLNQIALIAQVSLTQFPQQQEQLELIYNCCIIMNNMVKDLKDFHQLRSKTFQLEIIDVNVDAIFNELQHVFKQSATQKKITLFFVNKVKIQFKQDQQRIKQILQNLLQNAIKYTEQDGVIYVTAEKYDDKRIKFSVLDTGIGISDFVAQNIRLMMSNDLVLTIKISQGVAGLGIGLLNSNYLVKQLSSFQQGNKQQLQFSSKEGDGTNFWFLVSKYNLFESPKSQMENKSIRMIDKKTFLHQKSNNFPPPPSLHSNSKSCPSQFKRLSPKKNSQVVQQQYFFPSSVIENNEDNIIQEESHSVDEDPIPNHLPGPIARIPSLNTPECQCLKLLIVDDEPANLFPLQIMIKQIGYLCDIAQSGQQAINEVIKREKSHCQFRLILMDINMPQLNGIETTKRIKLQYPDIIIVACSAFSDMQTKYEAQTAGMEDYIEKPIDRGNLQEILEMYL